VKSQPLLVDLIELDLISGRVNVNAEGQSTGNSMNALLENSTGKADFNIEEGALRTPTSPTWPAREFPASTGNRWKTPTGVRTHRSTI